MLIIRNCSVSIRQQDYRRKPAVPVEQLAALGAYLSALAAAPYATHTQPGEAISIGNFDVWLEIEKVEEQK